MGLSTCFSEPVVSKNTNASNSRAPGGPRIYSDLAIETSLTLRTVFGLPLRQTEGFVGSLLRMLCLDYLPVPDQQRPSEASIVADELGVVESRKLLTSNADGIHRRDKGS
jgi:hypothetical protein